MEAIKSLKGIVEEKPVLVTGAAGFIGYHLVKHLTNAGVSVVGVDNISDYYEVSLKKARIKELTSHDSFQFVELDIADRNAIAELFTQHHPKLIVNLAAQAGVRYSLENPHAYIDANIVGFMNLLEACRHNTVNHLVFASSSSVYGANTKMPFSVHDNVDHPVSLYAATKKANELMAHTYSHLYSIPCTGLRFFTVYGPWGRPDMAYFKFTRAILAGEPIDVYNNGDMQRDFTYIDDIVEGVVRIMARIPEANPDWSGVQPDPGSSTAPYRLYNIGNNNPVQLLQMIEILERQLGRQAHKNMLPMQPGDVHATYADIDDLARDVRYRPTTSIEKGLEEFIVWYRQYYNV